MKNSTLALMLLSLSLLAACGKGNKSGQSSSRGLSPIQIEDEVVADQSKESVLQQLNKYRKASGAPELRYDSGLDSYAQGHAADISDGRRSMSSRNCSFRNNTTGMSSVCAEFVLRGQIFSKDVVQELVQAQRNQARLQDPLLKKVGIGASMDRQGRAVWVLLMSGHH